MNLPQLPPVDGYNKRVEGHYSAKTLQAYATQAIAEHIASLAMNTAPKLHEQFEAAFSTGHTETDHRNFLRHGVTGSYINGRIETLWEGWQKAAAALAPTSGEGVDDALIRQSVARGWCAPESINRIAPTDESMPVATVATLINPELADKDSGPFFSAQDWAALRHLPAGTKLYTTPQSAPVDGAFERAMKASWEMVVSHPTWAAGSYYAGQNNGMIAALKTVRENYEREIARMPIAASQTGETCLYCGFRTIEQAELNAAFSMLANFNPGADEFNGALEILRNGIATPPPASQERGGVSLIAAERERQVSVEGWTPEHDDEHSHGELATAAACYAAPLMCDNEIETTMPRKAILAHWPWALTWWKPGDRIRELVKAGALIAAEIDRLQRASPPSSAAELPDGCACRRLHCRWPDCDCAAKQAKLVAIKTEDPLQQIYTSEQAQAGELPDGYLPKEAECSELAAKYFYKQGYDAACRLAGGVTEQDRDRAASAALVAALVAK